MIERFFSMSKAYGLVACLASAGTLSATVRM